MARAVSLMENLDRGVVAVRTSTTQVFVSWRVLGTDPTTATFNLYRVTDGGAAVKLNGTVITGGTNYTDATADLTKSNRYEVKAVVYGVEQASDGSFMLPSNVAVQQYLRVALQRPTASRQMKDGSSYTYSPNDISVGDLDGDGQYEYIVKWDPSNSKDNSQDGYTGNVYIDAYKLDGTRLWRIDLGLNIRAGAHYTQFMVYDLDGDGIAEIACKTADGSVDGTGVVIGDPAADWLTLRAGRPGRVTTGPEYLSIFNGRTGREVARTKYLPARNPDTGSDDVTDAEMNALWGDDYANRMDRFLACIAYLDGKRPSLVMCRGYYSRTFLAAFDFRDGQLTKRWLFDSGKMVNGVWSNAGDNTDPDSFRYGGQGFHNLSVADVDSDGRDEIVYGSMVLDDNGTGLHSTGLGHGDAMHVSKMIPNRPGLQVWTCHEEGLFGHTLRDAATGEILMRITSDSDTGRTNAGHIDSRYPGCQVWGARANLIDASTGVQISVNKPSVNFMIWWDGDLQREILDGTSITKWNGTSAAAHFSAAGVTSINSTKANPGMSGDVLGDWREELILAETGATALRIYTTTATTTHRFPTLMHDRQYRLSIAWQNVAYNQPPHLSYYLGAGMETPPKPYIVTALSALQGPAIPVFTGISDDTGVSASDAITTDKRIVIRGTSDAGATVTITRLDFGVIGTALADGSGAWAFDYSGTELADGNYQFEAYATLAGVNGASTLPFLVTVDATIPATPVIDSVASSAVAGTLVISGRSSPGGKVTVFLDGAEIGQAAVNGQGLWSLSYADISGAGDHAFTAQAIDVAGNAAAPSSPVTVQTGQSAPAITGLTPDTGASSADGVTNSRHIKIQGTAAAGANVSVYVRGGAVLGSVVANGAGAWEFDHTGTELADGSYLFEAVVTGGGGTGPASIPLLVKVDGTAPAVLSIKRQTPQTEAVAAVTALTYLVEFSEPMHGLANASFAPRITAGTLQSSVTNVSVSGISPTLVSVTVSLDEGEATIGLNVLAAAITDVAGNALPANYTAGETYRRSFKGNGTWTNIAGGNWSENDNWKDRIIAAGALTENAYFNTLELTQDVTINLDAPQTIFGINFGDLDPGTSGGWIVAGNSTLTLSTSGNPFIRVDELGAGKDVRFDRPIASNAKGIQKHGVGTLRLTAQSNSLTGPVLVASDGGTLYLAPNSALNGIGILSISTGGRFVVDQASVRTNAQRTDISGTLLVKNAGTANLTGGEVRLTDGTFRVEDGIVSLAAVTLFRSTDGTVDFTKGLVVAGGTVTASGALNVGTADSSAFVSIEGGSFTASNVISVGYQTTVGLGGGIRVTGGRFTSTNTATGLALSRTSGANANNVSFASFLGGVSTIEKITLGFNNTVTAGSATVNLGGGALYLGSGGIVKSGTAGLATTISLAGGTLGAKAAWSTSHPVTLPADNAITLKAASEANAAFNITLSGVLSGAGGFTKTGAGSLILSGANTFTGGVALDEGTLNVTGSLATGGTLNVNVGGTLAGTGTINKALALNSAGVLAPAGTATAGTLNAASLTWNGGGKLAANLGATSDRLVLTGALTKGTAGAYEFVFSGTPAVGTTHTVMNFGTTDFVATDFSHSGLSGVGGRFSISGGDLIFTVTDPADTAFNAWANALPAGLRGATADADGDGLSNLLEFALGSDGASATARRESNDIMNVAGQNYPTLTYTRRIERGGVDVAVLVSASLDFSATLGSVEVSATAAGGGLETVVVRSAVSLGTQPRQFFRITASLP